MSAKIAAVNQTRSEPESTDRDVSVIDVERESMPPPPSYEQAIIVQSELERHRIQEQQRALEELVQEQNRMQRLRIEEQQIQQHPIQQQPIQQQPEAESIAQPTTPIPFPQIVQHVYASTPQVGPIPMNLTCPSCHAAIKTRIEYATTTKTHLGALLCCAVCWPCAFCPYFMKDCRDALHYCPSCGSFIGAHSP